VARFAGSTDYTSASAQTTFTIKQATPTVKVTDRGGTYTGSAFPATATVTGVGSDGTLASPTFTYYTPAPTPWLPPTPAAPTTPLPRARSYSPSSRPHLRSA
jgi:hypothetical protein